MPNGNETLCTGRFARVLASLSTGSRPSLRSIISRSSGSSLTVDEPIPYFWILDR